MPLPETRCARELFAEAIRNDSTFAPAYYEMAANGMYSTPDEAVELARKALEVYRRLQTENPKDPDNYRILAALYEQKQKPVSAIATLDSAVRFGRIPVLSAMKRRLLVATNQIDKAVVEARAMVEAAPYEAQCHVVLGDLYAIAKKDSLARAEYDRALQIDSTNVQTLMALADFTPDGRITGRCWTVTRQFSSPTKCRSKPRSSASGLFTSDMRFYREYYLQLNDLASTLAVRYPDDKRVVELYAKHLDRFGRAGAGPRALQTPPRRPAARGGVFPCGDRHRATFSTRFGEQIRHPRPGLFPDRSISTSQRACDAELSKQYVQAISAYNRWAMPGQIRCAA